MNDFDAARRQAILQVDVKAGQFTSNVGMKPCSETMTMMSRDLLSYPGTLRFTG